MKRLLTFAVLALSWSVLLGGTPPEKGKSNEAFERLKSLEGTWKGTTEDGKPFSVSYKVVSAGSVVMETDNVHENESSMITMYHLDGGKLMMTH